LERRWKGALAHPGAEAYRARVSYRLKRLSAGDLHAALAKATHYRDLNQPEEAESICRDILDVDSTNQDALKTLGLALTDRFPGAWVGLFEEAIAVFQRLSNEYDRVYYSGVAWERSAKAHLERGEAHSAVTSFEHALELFERAEKLAPAGTPDPILRWNRCVRLVTSHPLLLEAASDPRDSAHYSSD
jgi:tetratricopeptide (TPR) repeat protein